ncbi:hypothetical protein TSAR_007900 [Trichomalopsis sarcophagae]|uniref:Phospholipase A2-like domain-containing protein n=1 Tax=Trichomalopsis sarcophagae TaxID=543379 RepID=A0A232FMB4_9HYME|nr:hypothetical protein TSAR_007900 [Trichomalopsis sarcophagae]
MIVLEFTQNKKEASPRNYILTSQFLFEHTVRRRGRGLLNTLINKLPVELHLLGYQYCGPGTKLAKRLSCGNPGINGLDRACKEHYIAYLENQEKVQARNATDKILVAKALQRVRVKYYYSSKCHEGKI